MILCIKTYCQSHVTAIFAADASLVPKQPIASQWIKSISVEINSTMGLVSCLPKTLKCNKTKNKQTDRSLHDLQKTNGLVTNGLLMKQHCWVKAALRSICMMNWTLSKLRVRRSEHVRKMRLIQPHDKFEPFNIYIYNHYKIHWTEIRTSHDCYQRTQRCHRLSKRES